MSEPWFFKFNHYIDLTISNTKLAKMISSIFQGTDQKKYAILDLQYQTRNE